MSAARVEQRLLDAPVSQAGVALVAAGVVGLSLAVTPDVRIAFGLLAFGGLAALGLVRPAMFLVLFLAARPVLDAWSDQRLIDGLPSANPAGLTALLVIGLLIVALAAAPGLPLPRATGPMALMLAVSAIAAGWAIYDLRGAISLEPAAEMVRLTALLAVYVLAANLFTSRERVERLFVVVGLSGVVPAILGLVQWAQGPAVADGLDVGRIDSTFVGPNPFGIYLALCLLVLIGVGAQRLPRIVLLPSVALMLVALVGTYSRAGWGMFLIGLVLLEWRRRRGLVVGMAVVVAAVVLLVPTVHDRVLPSKDPGAERAPLESWEWRLDTWRVLVEKGAESPLIGYGLRSTEYINPRRMEVLSAPDEGYSAHNIAVKAFVEGGIGLVLAYVVLFGALLGVAWRLARARWPLRRHGAVVLVLWTVGIIVGVSAADIMGQTSVVFALFALTGALEGARRREAAS